MADDDNEYRQRAAGPKRWKRLASTRVTVMSTSVNWILLAGGLVALLITVVALTRKMKQGFRQMSLEGEQHVRLAPQQHGVYINLPSEVKIVATNPSAMHASNPAVLAPSHASLSHCYQSWIRRMRENFDAEEAVPQFYSFMQRQDDVAISRRSSSDLRLCHCAALGNYIYLCMSSLNKKRGILDDNDDVLFLGSRDDAVYLPTAKRAQQEEIVASIGCVISDGDTDDEHKPLLPVSPDQPETFLLR